MQDKDGSGDTGGKMGTERGWQDEDGSGDTDGRTGTDRVTRGAGQQRIAEYG